MPKRKVEKRKRSKSETESTSPKTNNSNTSKNIVSLKGSKEESIPQKPKVKINTSELPINFEEDGYDISENSSANNLGSDGELSEEEVVVKEVDSDDEIIPLDENTIGNVPIRWYDEYDHIGYNIDGEKILRPEKRDKIDEFLDQDDGTHWFVFLFFIQFLIKKFPTNIKKNYFFIFLIILLLFNFLLFFFYYFYF